MAELQAIKSNLEDFCGNFGQFDQAQKLNIAEAVRQAFEEQASLAQQSHQHGGDATCAGCIEYATHAMNTADSRGDSRGAARVTKYFEEIPGVKELRQLYEDAKAAVESGEETITITG